MHIVLLALGTLIILSSDYNEVNEVPISSEFRLAPVASPVSSSCCGLPSREPPTRSCRTRSSGLRRLKHRLRGSGSGASASGCWGSGSGTSFGWMLSDSVGAVRRKQRLRFSSCLFDTGRGFQDLKTSPARLIPSKAGQGDNQRKPERERESKGKYGQRCRGRRQRRRETEKLQKQKANSHTQRDKDGWIERQADRWTGSKMGLVVLIYLIYFITRHTPLPLQACRPSGPAMSQQLLSCPRSVRNP